MAHLKKVVISFAGVIVIICGGILGMMVCAVGLCFLKGGKAGWTQVFLRYWHASSGNRDCFGAIPIIIGGPVGILVALYLFKKMLIRKNIVTVEEFQMLMGKRKQ